MGVDLNLLRTFLAILETGSVTSAAADLKLTQPTVSHALGRLRRQLGDPLFVRHGTGLTPTPRARELAPVVRASLNDLDDALTAHHSFDPATTQRAFRLCLSDVGEASFLPAVLRAMGREAPAASVVAVPTDIGEATGWLRRGDVEAAVASVPLNVAGVHTILPGERYVALMSPTIAPRQKRLSLAQLASGRHVVVDGRVGHEQLDTALDALGVQRQVALRVRHFSVLPQLVAGDGLMTVLPAQMAETVASAWGLVTRELPVGVPTYDVNLYWDPEVTGPVGPRAWFVDLVRTALTGLTPTSPVPNA
ncbi:LysR family transcriptional regulator [Microbacterium gorillae]|uniref:LysR family transcriptional regulator n=1 Tax=Microbacterium gorillae TaxID=1231063 RepID=UPI00058BC991|nr:LysR family transcriptional regulator [Microbacterium gorillae]